MLKEKLLKLFQSNKNNEFQSKAMRGLSKYGKRVILWVGALLVIAAVLKYASNNITVSNSVDGRELPIYCVETEEKKVALSFDAAWGNEDTVQILDTLSKHKVHATFFMTGGWVEAFPEDVRKIYEEGHDLGNHGENHKNMSQLSDSQCQDEIMTVHKKVKELTGYEMFLFRPPYGDYDSHVITNAKECGYFTIQWDVDSLDWKDYGVKSIISTVCDHKHLGNGSIILCHNGSKYTAKALDEMLTKLESQGFTIVPVSELIYLEDYYMNHEGRQIKNNISN